MEGVCPACGASPVSGKFCSECGASLVAACPSCGASPVSGKFCSECGAALQPGRPPAAVASPAAERRVCSVLFADLVGFTPLSESRDPEAVRELLSHYFDTARTVITRYGGVVEKFIGDAVMAVWGTPVATEGDAERAVRAALDLVAGVAALGDDVHAPDLALRAGVVTGEVAVTLGASGEGMVAGDAVNTAARVQSAAGAGQVWVDEVTRRLTSVAIGFESAGEHLLKGKSEPVELHCATRVLSSVGGAKRVDGLEAPLLGRDPELRLIKELFHASAERHIPRLVVVAGPAGVGKSRLGWEFEKYLDGLAEAMWWHRGRCLSYGEGVAYWALAEIVRQRFGIAEEDPLDVAAHKLTELLPDFVPDPAEQAYVGPRLARLLGVSYADGAGAAFSREELFAGWRLFFERLSDSGPVVLLIEDGQHADLGLLDFLDHLIDWARNAPIFVLLFTRPELTERRPGWGVGRNRTVLNLEPLDTRAMDAMVDALVPNMPPDAVAAIAGQAQGNPLFAIETVRSLIDRDIVVPRGGQYRLVGDIRSLTVPDSLHGLLAARLDALHPDVRALIADAAVLGSSFPEEALVAISGRSAEQVEAALADLVRREVLEISADPLSPQRGSYSFSQNMLRQVAYDTLSRRDRKARHLAVAAHLQATFDGDEMMDVVAQHYIDALRAVDDDPDADEIRAKATAALLRAAERAEATGAPERAAEDFARAAELLGRSGADADAFAAARLWERASEDSRRTGNYSAMARYAQQAREIYQQHGRVRDDARTMVLLGSALAYQGHVGEARAMLTSALEVLRPDADSDTVAALRQLATVEIFAGDPDGAGHSEEALVLGQALDVPDGEVADLFMVRAMDYNNRNQHMQARALYEYGVRLAERAGESVAQARGLVNLAGVTIAFDPAAGEAAARAAYEILRRVGGRGLMPTALANIGFALIARGEWDAAEQALIAAIEDDGMDHHYVLCVVAILAALRGDRERARIYSSADMGASEDAQDRAEALLVDTFIAVAQGRPAETLRCAREIVDYELALGLAHEAFFMSWPAAVRAAFELGDEVALRDLLARLEAHPVGHVPPVLRAERALAHARLAAAAGSLDADADFGDALTQLRLAGSPYHLAHGLLDQAEHRVATGRADDADPLIVEAQRIAEKLRAEPLLARARAVRGLTRATAGA